MGQVSTPAAAPSIILSAVDRLVASNADGGLGITVAHVILLGENAGQNLNVSNVIALGFNAAAGGLVSPGAEGTTVVGSQSLSVLGASGAGPMTIVGSFNLPLVTTASLTRIQAFGDHILSNLVGGAQSSDSVFIGSLVLERLGQGNLGTAAVQDSVVIGTFAARGNPGGDARNYLANVTIGWQANQNWGNAGGEPGACVFIGRQAGRDTGQLGTDQQNTFVGDQAGKVSRGSRNSFFGASTDHNGSRSDNTLIGFGAGAGQLSGDNNTWLGAANAKSMNARTILLGYNVADDLPGGSSDIFAVGNQVAGVIRNMIYSDLSTGSIVLGNSTSANRDLPGTNALKLLNGTATGNPAGGGLLYVTAGQLSWRDTAGNDTLLSSLSFTVATLPAGQARQRAFVTDALAPAFGAAVVGGGAVFVPVYFDGTIWRVG